MKELYGLDHDWSAHPRRVDGRGTGHPLLTMRCHSCRGTGRVEDLLLSIIDGYRRDLKIIREDYDELRAWVERTSKCGTCGGNPMRTSGGIPCAECTLMGEQPWGG